MRLIDADALEVDWYEDDEMEDGDEYSYAYVSKYQIDEAPTVDAEPVRHGRWIDKSGGIEGAWSHCSVCGERAIDLYDYCPNCGAKMDE